MKASPLTTGSDRVHGLTFSRLALLVALVVATPGLRGFYKDKHRELIGAAFGAVRAARDYADEKMAQEASVDVDDNENSELDQYKHSMRPAGTLLGTARKRRQAYIDYHMRAAVDAATSTERDKAEAGRHLGLVLHAVQDEKHLWCSCSSEDNGVESAAPCSTSAVGCQSGDVGKGNHALRNCDWKQIETGIRARDFQLCTDGPPWFLLPQVICGRLRPTHDQLRQASQRSEAVLSQFVQSVQAILGRPGP